jgi:predicted SnoaL-like aldol condensation-catalyzing enzyme
MDEPIERAALRKAAAVGFLQGSASGNVREAYDRYVGSSFKHHNPYFGGDAASLRAGMEQNAAQNPVKALEVQRTIAEGDLVAVHSKVQMKPGDPELALVHIFRFDGDRIVELWDIAQPVPPDSPNENGMF